MWGGACHKVRETPVEGSAEGSCRLSVASIHGTAAVRSGTVTTTRQASGHFLVVRLRPVWKGSEEASISKTA